MARKRKGGAGGAAAKKQKNGRGEAASSSLAPAPPPSPVLMLLWAWMRSPDMAAVPIEIVDHIRHFFIQRATPSAKNVVVNPSCLNEHVGNEVGKLKREAITLLCNGPVRFNKYAGILELTNAAILFINLPALDQQHQPSPRSSSACTAYGNLLTNKGRNINWYAPERYGPAHPLVRRLREDSSMHVLLLCRPVGGAYLYLGTLRKVAHAEERGKGIRFDFELKDYARLRNNATFRQMAAIAD
ncbi:unnamed protein product [Vitrella brassicaformis CCMP3155]|uniref:Uncharacterized protein n=2 Tax=Vitrella brassicaformis TaxID=1169539 RepID=A0A0G4E9D5_VITBC|nr:unnamed protein product [Vitrella brassicaformis CCMP3155]|eukprot:CEL91991.1 unnamed protein product [Vitrella brassicaformis CCMP3155]